MDTSSSHLILNSSSVLPTSNLNHHSTSWEPNRERRRVESSQSNDDENDDENDENDENDDECEGLGNLSSEDTHQINSIHDHEGLEEGIREARRVNDDLTNQRNLILEFLLRTLQTAQTELSIELETHSNPLPRIRFHFSTFSLFPPSPRSIESEQPNRLPSSNLYHLSMLSRLNGLSQRTREVIQDIDRPRFHSDLTPLQLPPTQDLILEPLNDQDHPSSDPILFHRFSSKPPKIPLEQKLLIQWSSRSNLDLFGIKFPSRFEIPRKVLRTSNPHSISR
ncbi:hypothetical protein DFH28DRAFT_432762 [Melampsora americana]|nr:hypothetical protein DFH28DRAFT_432762 [Melampsora americana]